jgi:hypothetical protein
LFKDTKDISALEEALTDEGIARMLDVDVKAKLPTSVAVVGAEALAGPYKCRKASWPRKPVPRRSPISAPPARNF